MRAARRGFGIRPEAPSRPDVSRPGPGPATAAEKSDAWRDEEEVMGEAYIVDAVRAPVGRRKGGLSGAHPADLGAHPIQHLVERTDIDPAAIDDVIYGCIDAIGAQAGDIART